MTITLTLPQALTIIVGTGLICFAVGAACMFGLFMRDAPAPRLRVYEPPGPPPGYTPDPLPGEDEWFWSEWAADVDATLAAADRFIAARHR